MRIRSIVPSVLLVTVALATAGCSSDAKSAASTPARPTASTVTVSTATPSTLAATTATAASASSGTTAGAAAGSSGGGGTGGTGGTGIDACGQAAPDNVASTFVAAIAYSGADTYDQCFIGNAVTPDQIQKIIDKKFSSIQVVADATTGTYTFTAPDGTKMVIAVTKQSNGKYYVSSVTIP